MFRTLDLSDVSFLSKTNLWTPTELGADLALWLDAADTDTITLSGSNVSQWDDKSGNNRHASQAIAADQPIYTSNVLNGKPGVTFDGSTDFLTVAHDNALNAQIAPSSVVILYRERVSGFRLMQKAPSGTGASADAFFSSSSSVLGAAGTFTTSYPFWQNVWQFDVGTFSGNVIRHWRNGTKLVPTNVTGGSIVNGELVSSSTPATNSDPLFIGKRDNPSSTEGHMNGELLETLILTSALSTDDRQKLEGYLAWKWGLVSNLPVDHPYKTKPPTV